jgi:hypothetical protein
MVGEPVEASKRGEQYLVSPNLDAGSIPLSDLLLPQILAGREDFEAW